MDKAEVTLFSSENCPNCIMVKKYFKDNNVDYKNIDIFESDEAAEMMFQKSLFMGVPQIWINDQVIIGFDIQKINEILGIK